MPAVLAETTIPVLEAAIVARLRARVPGVAVEAYPDKPDGYRLLHQVGALLVSYRGARYTEPEELGEVVQGRELSFDVHVLSRSLSGHEGAYVHLEAARLALMGLKVPGFTKVSMRKEAFVGHGEGVWSFALTVAATTIAAELGEETVEVLLRRLTVAGELETTEVASG